MRKDHNVHALQTHQARRSEATLPTQSAVQHLAQHELAIVRPDDAEPDNVQKTFAIGIRVQRIQLGNSTARTPIDDAPSLHCLQHSYVKHCPLHPV